MRFRYTLEFIHARTQDLPSDVSESQLPPKAIGQHARTPVKLCVGGSFGIPRRSLLKKLASAADEVFNMGYQNYSQGEWQASSGLSSVPPFLNVTTCLFFSVSAPVRWHNGC